MEPRPKQWRNPGRAACTLLALLVLPSCDSKPTGTFAEVQAASGEVRRQMADVLAALGAAGRPIRDNYTVTQEMAGDRYSVDWQRTMHVPQPPDASEILKAKITPMLRARGWQSTDRSDSGMTATSFLNDKGYLSVAISRTRPDVSVIVSGTGPTVMMPWKEASKVTPTGLDIGDEKD